MPDTNTSSTPSGPPLWLFSILEMPYGVISGVIRILLPFLLRQSGLGLGKIGAILALISLPGTFCVFYTPVVDFWMRRRTWLLTAAFVSAACSAVGIWFLGAAPINLIALLFLGASSFAMGVSAATGGLMGALLHGQQRARVGGWVQAGNLGAASLGGGLLLMLASRHGNHLLAIAAVILIISPALAALTVPEPPLLKTGESYETRLRIIGRDIRQAFFSKKNIPGLLLLAAPVGTGAMATLMSGMTQEYGASVAQLAVARGFGGGVLTAAGALCAIMMPVRVNTMVPYAFTGLFYGIVCLAVSSGPLTPHTLVAGLLFANFARGLSFGCYTGVVLQIMGTGNKGQSSLYILLNSIGSVPIMYMTWFGGMVVERFGTRSLGTFDGLANITTVLVFWAWWSIRRPNFGQTAEVDQAL